MISGLLAACSSALAAAAVAVPAAAASTRYAAPAGTGPAASCAMADPCSLEDAVEAPEVGAGGVVVLAPGTYALGDRLDIDDSISVGGAPGAVPVIAAATPGQAAIAIDAAGAELHDATVLQGAGEPAIQLRHGLVDRVSASGDGAFTCELGVSDGDQSLLRDSVCWSGPAASGASAVTVRAGEFTRVWAAGSIAVGKKRYRIESGRTTLVAGQVRRLLLRPVKPRASRRIRKAIRHRKRARALLNATFVDLIGNRATSGEVDVKLKRRRGRR